jgi:hypothetical protein
MPKIGYGLVKRTKLMGVGVTTYKGLKTGDLFERGIRVSIYAKHRLISLIASEEKEMRSVMNNNGQDEYVCSSQITRGKGATASYVMLPGFGRLAFICCHLPFNARSLITERKYKNNMLRQNEVNQSNICFNNIIENLVLFKEPVPTHVIYFGDFNYRLSDPRPASAVAFEFIDKIHDPAHIRDMYQQYDELKEQMRRKNIYEFYEGISNQGPSFIPTCKMEKGRNYTNHVDLKIPRNTDLKLRDTTNGCHSYQHNILYAMNHYDISEDDDMFPLDLFPSVPSSRDSDTHQTISNTNSNSNGISRTWKTGKQDQRVPSWCDRILYNKFGNDGHNLICTHYDRFDVGETMSKSDHAGVLSIFELK